MNAIVARCQNQMMLALAEEEVIIARLKHGFTILLCRDLLGLEGDKELHSPRNDSPVVAPSPLTD